MRRLHWELALLGVCGVACAIFYLTRPKIPKANLFQPLQQMAQPALPRTEIETRTVEDAWEDLAETELVLGVAVNGEARAYPINMLTGPSREIVNDTLGGRKIAATW